MWRLIFVFLVGCGEAELNPEKTKIAIDLVEDYFGISLTPDFQIVELGALGKAHCPSEVIEINEDFYNRDEIWGTVIHELIHMVECKTFGNMCGDGLRNHRKGWFIYAEDRFQRVAETHEYQIYYCEFLPIFGDQTHTCVR